MANNKMLIDASHPEETRVVVLRGNRVEDFDFEAADKKQLRGNIYLAKVTRVEPSLQAAFVEYGGNRHGFLAFSEIHPDYYQIPVADRQALLEDEALASSDEDDEERPARRSRRHRRGRAEKRRSGDDETVSAAADESDAPAEGSEGEETVLASLDESGALTPVTVPEAAQQEGSTEAPAAAPETEVAATPASEVESPHVVEADLAVDNVAPVLADPDMTTESPAAPVEVAPHAEPPAAVDGATEAQPAHGEATTAAEASDESGEHEDEDEHVEQLGGDDIEDVQRRVPRTRKQYKIQEVIKRRQVLLVQVVKEERGNKGAALTTYLSLAGRYSVLMPNTARGGGISRKITDSGDRARLKAVAQELDVPEGMGVILRTAGASRSIQEVRRDFEYLLRMWETVRETTLQSSAPTLVYEEGSLIKRSIRDLYGKEIDEVVVAGDEGYREARDFMRLLMPTHTRAVQPYRDPQPLYARYGVETQLDAMFSPQVTLKSGGYIVINQTEALVAIDVNSGRSTREHDIEDTALRTNLEAADEVARQLRLRDLAGLIVVDFIDMDENRNNRSVERRLKEALKEDRARIQVGRISHFGLLEMSRQRIRTGVFEGSAVPCPHCAGAGMVRSTSSLALHVLRVLEDTLIKSATHNLTLRTRTVVALYVLNQKRDHLRDLETRFGVRVTVMVDETLTGMTYHAIERGEPATGPIAARPEAPAAITSVEDEDDAFDDGETIDESAEVSADPASARDGEDGDAGRRRRRRRRRGRDREPSGVEANAPQPSDEALAVLSPEEADGADATSSSDDGEAPSDGGDDTRLPRTRRRRSRRGRRDSEERDSDVTAAAEGSSNEEEIVAIVDAIPSAMPVEAELLVPAEAPLSVATSSAIPSAPASTERTVEAEPAASSDGSTDTAPAADQKPASKPVPASTELDPSRPKRTGWWQRAKATLGG